LEVCSQGNGQQDANKEITKARSGETYLGKVEPRQAEDDGSNTNEHKIVPPSYFFKCRRGALQEDDGRNK
jgi:hypothetical protein